MEELQDRMTHAEFVEQCEYETWNEQRVTKLDLYLARLTAYMAVQANPKGNYKVGKFIIGGDDDHGKDLRKMSSDEVKAAFMAIPGAIYKEAPSNG